MGIDNRNDSFKYENKVYYFSVFTCYLVFSYTYYSVKNKKKTFRTQS